MRRFQKLEKISEYINSFTVPGTGLKVVVTIAQADATSKLTRLSDRQVLAARPECHQRGDGDGYSSEISTAFFVIEKRLEPANTPEREDRQFSELLTIAGDIVDKICNDISSGSCNLLSGMSLSNVDIVPESSLFGGWTGYSVELTFE